MVEQASVEVQAEGSQDKIYAQDILVGASFELGTYTVSEPEIIEFATAWDPYPFHIDQEAAKNGFFGGIIASGVHTMAIYQRLSTLGPFRDWAVIAGRGIEELQLRAPVRPDDTLTGRTVIVDVEFKRNSRALITIDCSLHNQEGVEVLRMTMKSLVASREPSPVNA